MHTKDHNNYKKKFSFVSDIFVVGGGDNIDLLSTISYFLILYYSSIAYICETGCFIGLGITLFNRPSAFKDSMDFVYILISTVFII